MVKQCRADADRAVGRSGNRQGADLSQRAVRTLAAGQEPPDQGLSAGGSRSSSFCGAALIVISILIDESPLLLAVRAGRDHGGCCCWCFKDTILSLVASVQLSTNDMLRVARLDRHAEHELPMAT